MVPAEPVAARVQLCGPFAVELAGRRIDHLLPGRQGRLLVGYLALHRHQRIPRAVLVDALWGESPPGAPGTALNALVSKIRAVAGPAGLPARVDVEDALTSVHAAETAVAVGDWRRVWTPSLTAHFVTRRRLLPESDAPWVEAWRRRLHDVGIRALECYGTACLELGGAELPGAERAARELVELAPLRETGHLLLMRALAARGNVAEALAAYERLRVLLREELGVDPCRAVQDAYAGLLA
jgi:DNA-binding SARP family transcriptional activator